MATAVLSTTQALPQLSVTSFDWGALTTPVKHSYIDPKTNFTIGKRHAWYATVDFEDRVWKDFMFPKVLNVYNKNQKAIFGSRRKPFCEIKCYMTNTSQSWQDARPTVIASCKKPKIAQSIISVLTGNPIILRLDSGFDFYADPAPADSIMCANTTELLPPVLSANALSLCGTRILISAQSAVGDSRWRHATLGGVLQIDDAYYGITAAHAFSSNSDSESDDGEESDGRSECNSSTDISTPVRSSSEPVHRSPALRSGATVYIDPASYLKTTDDRGSSEVTQTGKMPELRAEHVLGELHGLDSQSAWLNRSDDWALIKISRPELYLSNKFALEDQVVKECSNVAIGPPRGQVAIIAGFSGVSTAHASGRMAGILLPGAPEMSPAWTVEGSSLTGDCGSWIVDSTSGDIFGMLVASSKSRNLSYCLPMSKIFDSITSTLHGRSPAVSKPTDGRAKPNSRHRDNWNKRLSIGRLPISTGTTQKIGTPPTSTATQHISKIDDKKDTFDVLDNRFKSDEDMSEAISEFTIPSAGRLELEANDPDDENLKIRASQVGNSCYKIYTSKIDRRIAQRLGYELWQGPVSTMIETDGKNLELSTLLQESSALRSSKLLSKAAIDAVPGQDDEAKSLVGHANRPVDTSVEEEVAVETGKELVLRSRTNAQPESLNVPNHTGGLQDRFKRKPDDAIRGNILYDRPGVRDEKQLRRRETAEHSWDEEYVGSKTNLRDSSPYERRNNNGEDSHGRDLYSSSRFRNIFIDERGDWFTRSGSPMSETDVRTLYSNRPRRKRSLDRGIPGSGRDYEDEELILRRKEPHNTIRGLESKTSIVRSPSHERTRSRSEDRKRNRRRNHEREEYEQTVTRGDERERSRTRRRNESCSQSSHDRIRSPPDRTYDSRDYRLEEDRLRRLEAAPFEGILAQEKRLLRQREEALRRREEVLDPEVSRRVLEEEEEVRRRARGSSGLPDRWQVYQSELVDSKDKVSEQRRLADNEAYYAVLRRYRGAEKRLRFENRIQKLFLDGDKSHSDRIDCIMQYFGELETETVPSAATDKTHREYHEHRPDSLQKMYRPQQANYDLEDEYTHLVNRYRIDALLRGLSITQINTILSQIKNKDVTYRLDCLKDLLKRSGETQQKTPPSPRQSTKRLLPRGHDAERKRTSSGPMSSSRTGMQPLPQNQQFLQSQADIRLPTSVMPSRSQQETSIRRREESLERRRKNLERREMRGGGRHSPVLLGGREYEDSETLIRKERLMLKRDDIRWNDDYALRTANPDDLRRYPDYDEARVYAEQRQSVR